MGLLTFRFPVGFPTFAHAKPTLDFQTDSNASFWSNQPIFSVPHGQPLKRAYQLLIVLLCPNWLTLIDVRLWSPSGRRGSTSSVRNNGTRAWVVGMLRLVRRVDAHTGLSTRYRTEDCSVTDWTVMVCSALRFYYEWRTKPLNHQSMSTHWTTATLWRKTHILATSFWHKWQSLRLLQASQVSQPTCIVLRDSSTAEHYWGA